MQCGHCPADYHPQTQTAVIGNDADGVWYLNYELCPRCKKFNMRLVNGSEHPQNAKLMGGVRSERVIPEGRNLPQASTI